MRKRKVTLTNNKTVVVGENGGDTRQVVQKRQVIIGAKSGSATPPVKAETATNKPGELLKHSRNSYSPPIDFAVDADYFDPVKKPRLDKDQRLFTLIEEGESALSCEEGDKGDISKPESSDETNVEEDVRIIVSKNERDVGDNSKNDNKGNNGKIVDRQVDQENDENVNDDSDVDVDNKDNIAGGQKGEELQTEVKTALDDGFQAKTSGEDDVSGKGVKDVTLKKDTQGACLENKSEGLKKDDEKKKRDNEKVAKVEEKSGDADTRTLVPAKNITGNGDIDVDKARLVNSPKLTSTKHANGANANHVASAAVDSGDVEGSGSDSDSSRSSGSSRSSSSYSGLSSSSGSNSRSSSDSDSDSGSDDNSRSSSKSRSRDASESSSSYSYSTSGSPDRTTLRSVVAQTNRPGQRQRFRRSPDERRSYRDRRDRRRSRSYDDEDRYRHATREGERSKRREESWCSRRRSPYRRRGREITRSPSRFGRRESRERNRSRERGRRRRSPYSGSDSRQARRRIGSRSPKVNVRRVRDSGDSENALSRKEDDYVDIDVTNLSHKEEKRSGWRERKKNKSKGLDAGFDLRSKLGPKKPGEKDLRQGMKNQRQRQSDTPSLDKTVAVLDVKELELNARIEQIRMMNEKIKKRKEEIEREKILYS